MGATSPSGLELTMAVPGLSSSSGSGKLGRAPTSCFPSPSPSYNCKYSFRWKSWIVFSVHEGFVCNNNISNNGGGNMRDLDMNQPASGGEEEDFLMGGVEEDEEERGAGGPHRPKKLRLSKEQSRLLEESFRLNHTLSPSTMRTLPWGRTTTDPLYVPFMGNQDKWYPPAHYSLLVALEKQKEALAIKLKLRPRQVEVWFQNRRARTKLKHTEMECEYLKRCFGSLTEENRRLQREVEELRAMRMAPPTVLSPHTRQPLPASALTMCPRCERVTAATCPRITRPAASPFHPRRPSAAF
ncbi:unnamed protein product [Triticum turgidum subsp. durum]|uniref:Homeobox domain-containing protein n=1 Tax=Triticum turgidum subsp. durum TaxID=4567 RepID=A0A9R0VMJ3_TRITD|nr:unnamed protein product [Triticum turgidum subsp. durum]